MEFIFFLLPILVRPWPPRDFFKWEHLIRSQAYSPAFPFTWCPCSPLRTVMGFGIYIFSSAFLVRTWLPREVLSGSTFLGPKPTHRLFPSLGIHVALWASQCNADFLQLTLLLCAFFLCVFLLFFWEPEQLSPTDEILILGFGQPAFVFG